MKYFALALVAIAFFVGIMHSEHLESKERIEQMRLKNKCQQTDQTRQGLWT